MDEEILPSSFITVCLHSSYYVREGGKGVWGHSFRPVQMTVRLSGLRKLTRLPTVSGLSLCLWESVPQVPSHYRQSSQSEGPSWCLVEEVRLRCVGYRSKSRKGRECLRKEVPYLESPSRPLPGLGSSCGPRYHRIRRKDTD